MLLPTFKGLHLCVDYWLLVQETIEMQIRKFEFEALAKEPLFLSKEYCE